jgi:hypothetical protein
MASCTVHRAGERKGGDEPASAGQAFIMNLKGVTCTRGLTTVAGTDQAGTPGPGAPREVDRPRRTGRVLRNVTRKEHLVFLSRPDRAPESGEAPVTSGVGSQKAQDKQATGRQQHQSPATQSDDEGPGSDSSTSHIKSSSSRSRAPSPER